MGYFGCEISECSKWLQRQKCHFRRQNKGVLKNDLNRKVIIYKAIYLVFDELPDNL